MRFWMVIVGTLAGCGVTEIEEADPTRCFDDTEAEGWSTEDWGITEMPSAELDACCEAAAVADCDAGLLAVQALHGPAGVEGEQPQHQEFADRCEMEHAAAAYCAAYCGACPDYEPIVGDEAISWTNDTSDIYADCDCG